MRQYGVSSECQRVRWHSEIPYTLPILLANCPADLRFGPKEYSLSPNGGGGRMDHDANPPRPDDEGVGGSSQDEKALSTAKLE